jgi:pSer/pThr/pTyr-binding forkhead associated (FHA) protein
MLKLIIEDDEGKTTVVPLIRDEITIGRKEGNTIRLTERNVSRRHAKLCRSNGEVTLEDLGSYNGIKVNGSRISGQAAVGEGDRIQIGDYILAFKQDQPAAAASSPADPFDDMKTVPVEKAEAQAMKAHLMAGGEAKSGEAGAVAAEEAPTKQLQQDLIAEAAQVSESKESAKMVVVSSNFAGLECILDKAAQVIGRTDDNDVVINHRSISRHHAKIVRQGDSYTVVDHASANGVFVNGEKYDRVELRPGDMVDLGHVRMRFVGAGEAWVFDPTNAVDTSPSPGKSKTTLFGVVGAVVALAAIVAILFGTGIIGGDKKNEGAQTTKNSDGTDPMSDMDPDGAVDAGTQLANYKPIQDAITAKNWPAAIKSTDSILIQNPQDTQARKLKAKAVEEQKNKGHRDRFFEAVGASNMEKAVLEGSQIATDSVYYPEVSKRLASEKKKYKPQLIKLAKRSHKKGQCVELKAIATKMQALDPNETAVASLVTSCRSKDDPMTPSAMDPDSGMAVDPPRRPGMRRRTPRPRTMRTEPMRPVESGGASAAELYAKARAAWLAGQCGNAIKLARKANRKKFSTRHVSIIGACACSLRRKSTAKWAYKILRGGQRNMLLQICRSKGIELP